MAGPPKKRTRRSLLADLLPLVTVPQEATRVATDREPAATLDEVLRMLGRGLGTAGYRAATALPESAPVLERLPGFGPAGPLGAAMRVLGIPGRAAEWRRAGERELEEFYGRPASTAGRAALLLGTYGPELLPFGVAPVAARPLARAAAAAPSRLTPTEMVDFLRGIAPDPLAAPAFARAGGRVRTVGRTLGTGDLARLPARFGPLRAAIARGGDGFTLDRAGLPFSGTGYAVARPNLTVQRTGAPGEVETFLARPDVQAALERPDTYVGGWKGEINVTDIVDDQQRAVSLARQRKQKAYGEFKDGEYLGDREYVLGASVRGADGKTYTGLNHGDARDNAAEALRATPEGRAAMERNGGNAMIRGSEGFQSSGLRNITREEAREIGRAQAPGLAPEYTQLHSSDLLPREQQLPGGRGVPAAPPGPRSQFPEPEVLASGALAGAPARNWYENSARAIVESLGPRDGERFAAVLAALSPRRQVPDNLKAALRIWDQWTRGGRKRGEAEIREAIGRTGKGEIEARVQNVVRALSADRPAEIVLRGEKVSPFHRNLLGETDPVALDTWMARIAGVPQSVLAKPGPYSEYADRIRAAAELLGPGWNPAGTQAGLWAWGKAATEPFLRRKFADPAQIEAALGLEPGIAGLATRVPESAIERVPDFGTLLRASGPALERVGARVPSIPIAPRPVSGAPDPSALRLLTENIAKTLRGGRGAALGGLSIYEYLQGR